MSNIPSGSSASSSSAIATPRPVSPSGDGRGSGVAQAKAQPSTSFAAHLKFAAHETRRDASWPALDVGSSSPIRSMRPQSPSTALVDEASAPTVDHTRARARAEDEPTGLSQASDLDALDPMSRALACPLPVALRSTPLAAAAPASAPVDVAPRLSMEHVMTRLVRRIAWSGDAQSGAARLELGAGELEGATLIIHAASGALRVSLELPPGVDRAAWRERIAQRLDARGLQVDSLDVA